jgi:predicted transposase YbfD/YdcC
VGENQITLGEIKSESKRREIKEIPKLLDTLDIAGHIVTIDSIGCQLDIVKKISEKKSDYVIGLKKNQKNLHKAVEEYFLYNPKSANSAINNVYEAGHGRVEQREYWLARHKLAESKVGVGGVEECWNGKIYHHARQKDDF